MEKLYPYGWENYVSKRDYSEKDSQKKIGRVTSIKGNIFEIASERGVIKAELLGKMLFALEKWEQPKVGDWVHFLEFGENAFIDEVLPRFNQLYRKTAGKEISKQVIVANIDKAVIIQGVDNDFNISRVERYIVQIRTCNIEPVIILNKCDLVDDIAFYIREIEKLQRNIEVYLCSVKSGSGIKELKQNIFKPQTTNVLIGSSGVGKSSIINELLQSNYRTSAVSDSTGKGRHTTTTRDMFLLDNGSIVIDTPGMREFGIAFDDDSNFNDQFPVISRHAIGCKYKNCSHLQEEGCNVISAYNNGLIDPIVYESYLKLHREQKRFEISTQDKKKLGKQFGKMSKEATDYRKKYKY